MKRAVAAGAVVLGLIDLGGLPAQVRDSAGIRIVDNRAPTWTAAQRWRVDPKPSLSIGLDEGDEPYLFSRVYSAIRLANGAIVVGNSGSSELRLFTAAGKFIRVFGRRGAGPGEFSERSSLILCILPGNDLLVVDYALRRAHTFSSNGQYKRTFSFQQEPGTSAPYLRSCFADGTLLTNNVPIANIPNEPGKLLPGTMQYFRYGTDGRSLARLAEVPDRTRYVHQHLGMTQFPYVPFTPESMGAAAARVAYINYGGMAQVDRRALDGKLEALIRWQAPRTRTSAIYDRYVAANLPATNEQRRPADAAFYALKLPIPDLVPVVGHMIVDAQDNLWAKRYQMPWDSIPTYEVFDSSGRWLGQVTTPARVDVYQIGKDFLLGRHRDELGVERIRTYVLHRQ
ncbi:MAG: 6-bladed beta-propeller [Gemmatimonadota bacterium]